MVCVKGDFINSRLAGTNGRSVLGPIPVRAEIVLHMTGILFRYRALTKIVVEPV